MLASAPALPASAAQSPVTKALGAIADTPADRSLIAVNNLSALWHSAGVSGVPTLAEVLTAKGKAFAASTEIVEGSPIGAGQFEYLAQNPAPLGYNPLALNEELLVGEPPNQLTEVWGPIKTGPVSSTLHKLKPKPTVTSVNGSQLFDFGPPTPSSYQTLGGLRRLALLPGGGGVVGGGGSVPQAELLALASGRLLARPLSSDPAVKQLLAVFPSDPTVFTMGTSLITQPAVGRLTPAQTRAIATATKLSQLRAAPTFVGLATSGPPTATRVTAAAVYPSGGDAKAALASLGTYMRTGTSFARNEPYKELWRVTSSATHGDVAEVQLTTLHPQVLPDAIATADFPLFWKPFGAR